MTNSKPPHRFVPTLTEVVHPGPLPVAPPMDCERLAEQVMQSIKPRLEHQLRAALQAQVEEQMRVAATQWQQDIEDAVRVAVAKAVRSPASPDS